MRHKISSGISSIACVLLIYEARHTCICIKNSYDICIKNSYETRILFRHSSVVVCYIVVLSVCHECVTYTRSHELAQDTNSLPASAVFSVCCSNIKCVTYVYVPRTRMKHESS